MIPRNKKYVEWDEVGWVLFSFLRGLCFDIYFSLDESIFLERLREETRFLEEKENIKNFFSNFFEDSLQFRNDSS